MDDRNDSLGVPPAAAGSLSPSAPAIPDAARVTPCSRPSLGCPHMKGRENDTSMTHEHYDCKVCGGHIALDYEEMR